MSFIGRQLGDFVLDKKLGAGGMGEVYRARQVSLDRIVAVKVLPRVLATQEGFEERFRREARAAANLIHPNVIQVYHIGIDPEAGTPYFAMEYVEGEDLQQRMKRVGRLPFDQTVETVCGVTAALACAFEKGIVHRDIKPSNIMFDKNEIVKVMDFGLAKATQDKGAHNLTQSGLIMGTPNYISPEAGKGDPIDMRSDIYSLGVVFYELLCGNLPFTATTPAAIIYKHVYEPPPPPREIAPDVPPYLEEVCLRMMAKEPKDRYPNAKALLADLNEFKRHTEYYLKGGARRTPSIPGQGSFSGDSTLAASGEFPGRPGPGSRSAESTQGFRTSDTSADGTMIATGSSPQLMQAPSTGSGNMAPVRPRLPIAVVAGVSAVVVFVGAFLVAQYASNGGKPTNGTSTTGPTGSTTVPKTAMVIFPFSELAGILPKRTDVFVVQGMADSQVGLVDRSVDPGEYTLVFKRRGFDDLSRKVKVSAAGVEPPFEELRKLEFRESDDTRKETGAAEKALQEKKFSLAIDICNRLLVIIPDYPPAVEILRKATDGQRDLEYEFQRGFKYYSENRWDDAIATFKPLPPTYDKYETAQRYIAGAVQGLESLQVHRNSCDRYCQEGNYKDALLDVDKIEKYLPTADTEPRIRREKIELAKRNFDDGKREYENKRWDATVEKLKPVIEFSPRYEEAARMYIGAEANREGEKSKTERLAFSLKEGQKALEAGSFAVAEGHAKEALKLDPGNATAKELLDRARAAIAKGEIVKRFEQLDREFKTLSSDSVESRAVALLEMIDAPVRAALKPDIDLFDASPIRIIQADHEEFSVELPTPDTVVVQCTWRLRLAFPLADGKETPFTVRQKAGLKKLGDVWFFTSFEQMGPANVKVTGSAPSR